MKRFSILAVLSTTLLFLVACQPVLQPSEAPLSSDDETMDEADTGVNSIAFDGEVYKVGEEVWGIASDDLNGDGLPDIVVSDAASGGIGVFLNPGDGVFANGESYATGESPNSVTPIDVDGDGDLDLAVANGGSDTISLLTNDGNGLFEKGNEFMTGAIPWWVITADMNVDDLPDLVYVHDKETAGVFINDAEGGFQEMTEHLIREETVTGSVSAGDVNGDGLPDMMIRLWPEPIISILLNEGDDMYGQAVHYEVLGEPHGAYPMDLNADGSLDIIVPTGGDGEPGRLNVLLNDGAGAFLPPAIYAIGAFPLDVAGLDFDGDDDLDLLVTSCGSETVYGFVNDGGGQLQRTDGIVMPACPVEIVVDEFDGLSGPEMVVSSFDGSLMVMTLPVGLGQDTEVGSSQQSTSASEEIAGVETDVEAVLAPRPKPARVLFIGDDFVSRNLGIGALLAGIVNAADPDTIIETEYLAGDFINLVQHSNLDAPAKIREGDWDAVVLQEDLFVWSDTEFYDGVRALDKIIDETDAATVILVPWADKKDQGMTDEMEAISERIGVEVDATLVPVGQAWQRLRERDADVLLTDGARWDITVSGSYLNALVFYHSLYGGEPDFVPFLPVDVLPNPAEPSYSMEKMRDKWAKALSEEDAALLQQIAWETVMAYELGQIDSAGIGE